MINLVVFLIIAQNLVLNINAHKPLIISHRAASGYLPEQTLESELMAYMLNTDLIEIDVILSADNRVIITHDVTLDETTNIIDVYPERARNDSHFYCIDFTYDELKQLKVSERFKNRLNLTEAKYPNRFPLWSSYFHLHTLEEAIELIDGLHKTYPLKDRANPVSFLIEIKRPYFHVLNNKTNLSEIVLNVLDKYGYNTKNSPFIIQSFDPFELMRIRDKTPLRILQLLQTDGDVEYEEDINRINNTFWSSTEGLKNISTYSVGMFQIF
jgi:glycerophosphoryl diester phosphodiesterase